MTIPLLQTDGITPLVDRYLGPKSRETTRDLTGDYRSYTLDGLIVCFVLILSFKDFC